MRTFLVLLLIHFSLVGAAQCTPVLDLPFSGNAIDISGNNNNAIASGSPTLTTDRFGNANSAYEFGGVGDVDFFTVTNNPTLQFTNQLSISYWFKQCSFQGMDGYGQTVANGNHVVMAKLGDGYAAQPGLYFFQNVNSTTNQLNWSFTNKPLYGSGANAVNFQVSSSFNCINLCEWVHVVVVVNNTNIKAYFNGVLVQNQTINQPDFTVANTKNLLIGKMDGVWYPYKGTLDDIKIYNCAINEATIATLYGGFTDPNNANINPTFDPIGTVCAGQNFTLPTTSNNGVTGTWSPAINNTQTTTYVFTPTAGQCANATQMTVTVGTQISPTFTAIAPICFGGTFTLPTTSTNGITGTWSPAINNTATTTYTFTPTNSQCSSTAQITVTVNPQITPTFTAIAPICSGGTFTLPTTSTNGIAGTWSPAINNTATTTYTFTPTNSQCASTTQMTVTVNPQVTPTFTAVTPICSGGTFTLPTTSTNGISGTWSPAVNNTTTTTYTFTPTNNECASTTQMTVTVNPQFTPTFTAIAPICSGGTFTLPSTSTNGISGTWLPAVNNQTTTTYTFTPTSSQCASTTQMTVTVNPQITPTFTAIAPICSGETFTLPTTSTNGIVGTWSPAINNQATTTYTFTPTNSQCASAAQITVTVNPQVTPTFTAIAPICSGGTFTLPSTSTNGISGTWSPVINNQATTTYTFTPTNSQCSSTAQITVTVNPQVTPTFTAIAPICSGETFTLPTTSTNGISGTWSPAINNQVITTYTFTPTNSQCASTTQITVTVNPKPFVTLENQILCLDANTQVITPVNIKSGLSNLNFLFQWFFTPSGGIMQVLSDTGSSISVNQPGTYSLKVTNLVTNCSSEISSCEVTLNETPLSINVETTNHFSDFSQIYVSVNGNATDLRYQLNDNYPQTSPLFSNLPSGNYMVKVFDDFGCFYFEKLVVVLNYMKFFTPNNDSYNDYWKFDDINSYIKEVTIFDRYGKLLKVLKSNEILAGWDGKYNGIDLPSTDYWFVVYYEINGEQFIFKSHFSLKR